MATVYQGFDTQLQRPVAVKVLSAALAANPEDVQRFRREAQLIASLRHPNVAQIFAYGEEHGLPYMVQEFLPGATLEQRLNELLSAGRFMPRSELLATVAQLAAALDAAHAIGVIHRDVKPSNAIANAAGELVLTDFGIARSSGDTNLTSPGVLLGTPNYVAPEQATTNSGLTIAVDVYALGVLTFQLLTNELPFSGATATAVVIKHLAEDPPKPSDRRPDLPPAIDSVVLRAMAKDPATRFPHAGAFAAALAQAWPATGVAAIHTDPTVAWASPTAAKKAAATPRPVVAAPRQRRMLPWLGLLLMLFFVLAAIAAWRGSTPVPDHAGQPGSAAPTSIRERPAAVAATSAPPPSEQPVATAEPTPTELRLPTATTEPSPTLMPTEPPSPTDPPALEAPVDMVDPVLALGALLTAGDADGRAGQRGKELLDHYWKLIDALANGESRKAEDQIRDMRRKLAERKRDQPIDPEFVAETEQLLDRILQIYQLRRR